MGSYADPHDMLPIMGHIPSKGPWLPDSLLTRLFHGCRPDSFRTINCLHECTARSSVIDRSMSILASADDYSLSREVSQKRAGAGACPLA